MFWTDVGVELELVALCVAKTLPSGLYRSVNLGDLIGGNEKPAINEEAYLLGFLFVCFVREEQIHLAA